MTHPEQLRQEIEGLISEALRFVFEESVTEHPRTTDKLLALIESEKAKARKEAVEEAFQSVHHFTGTDEITQKAEQTVLNAMFPTP